MQRHRDLLKAVKYEADNILKYFSYSFLRRQFALSVKAYFLGKIRNVLSICFLLN